jgi:ribosomal protein S6--L-glutamate ligase
MKKVVALWMYRNEGGDIIQEKIKKKLEEKGITVINDFDMRKCFCFNGKVFTKTGFDLSSVDLLYHMNADEQTEYQNEILRAIELSGVKIINPWNAFYTAKHKFMTNTLLARHGITVPPALFMHSSEILQKAEEIFEKWKKICVKSTHGHGGKGIMAFESLESFQDFVEFTSPFTDRYYIEKLIPFGDHDYRVEIFNGEVVCGYCRNKTHSFKTNIHSKGYFIETVPNKEFEEIALKAAKILNITATIVDMVQSQQDGKIYLLEVNHIMGAFVEAYLEANKNTTSLYSSFTHDKEKINLLVNYITQNI